MKLELYTDGGCSGNPGIGGYAYVIRLIADRCTQSYVKSGYKENTTNNHMELKAIVEGLSEIVNSPAKDLDVVVTSDSSYCINAFTQGWIHGWRKKNFMKNGAPMPNRDLWLALDKIVREKRNIQWVWVRGHNGHRFNEICDEYAVRSYRERKNFSVGIEVVS